MTSGTLDSVHFVAAQIGAVHREATLLNRFRNLLDELHLEQCFGARDKIAIKMHVGGPDSYTTVHPQFVRAISDRFASGDNFLYVVDEHRAVRTAWKRGYSRESLGAPVWPISGIVDRYHDSRRVGDSPYFDEIRVAGNVAHADGLIVISHAKGHASCGFGGAIKNVGIGCVAQETRNHIHTFEGHDNWQQAACESCDAPHDALAGSADRGQGFSEALARSAAEVLAGFARRKVVCLNVALNVHPYCDCWGLSSPGLCPDIGLFLGHCPAAVDAAALEAIQQAPFIHGSLPDFLSLSPASETQSGHVLERLHGKNPLHQIHAFRRCRDRLEAACE